MRYTKFMNIFAHAGEEHATETDSLVHVLKGNAWQILVLTAVFVFIAVLISTYSRKKPKPSKKEKAESEKESE